MNYDFDVFVIGAGSGGLAASKRAAQYGKKVALCENSKVGGTCVIRGCIPKKLMSYAADIAHTCRMGTSYGFDIDYSFDFKTLVENRNAEIDRLNKLHISLLDKAGVHLIEGQGTLKDTHTVTVNGKDYTAQHIILATGTRPWLPNIPGIEHGISSDGIWELNELPKEMVIVGGGYIAVEFASIFNALGTKVHMVIRRNTLLGGFDADIRHALQDEMEKAGIIFHCAREVVKLSKHDDQLLAELDCNSALKTDICLFATGRVPNTETLNLQKVGVKTDKIGAVKVNKRLHTFEDVYAIGDITNRVNLTPVAIRDGRLVADNLFNNTDLEVDDADIATAVFTSPPVGVVGLTEEAAQEKYGQDNIKALKTSFRPLMHNLSGKDEKTTMKAILHAKSKKVLGLHMVGKDAPEIIQGFAAVVKMGGTLADLNATIAIHPSSAEEFVLFRE